MSDVDLVRLVPTPELTAELRTLEHVWGLLVLLTPQQRERVLMWLCHHFDVGGRNAA